MDVLEWMYAMHSSLSKEPVPPRVPIELETAEKLATMAEQHSIREAVIKDAGGESAGSAGAAASSGPTLGGGASAATKRKKT